RITFGGVDHLLDATRKEQVIREDELAILASRRNVAECIVMVWNHRQELLIAYNSNAPVLGSVSTRDRPGSVGAAVIYNRVVPIRIGLTQHALDACGKVLGAVIDRREDTDQRLGWRRQLHLVARDASCRRSAPQLIPERSHFCGKKRMPNRLSRI